MKVRYKQTGVERPSNWFNMSTYNEVLTSDDSAYINELDVWLEALGQWKDMREAFRDHDLITNNYNTRFFEPSSAEDRERGFTLD